MSTLRGRASLRGTSVPGYATHTQARNETHSTTPGDGWKTDWHAGGSWDNTCKEVGEGGFRENVDQAPRA